MERVETLCERLKEQIANQVSIDELLMTVQMLQSELLHLKNNASSVKVISSINIDIPVIPVVPQIAESQIPTLTVAPKIEFVIDDIVEDENVNKKEEIEKEEFTEKNENSINEIILEFNSGEEIKTEEKNVDEFSPVEEPGNNVDEENPLVQKAADEPKVFITLELDETALEEELQQIKKSAEIKNTISSVNKPMMLFDPLEEIPTLSHQRMELSSSESQETDSQQSINDVLKQDSHLVSEHLNNEPIKDLKKAISINERFLFINELFNGEELTYDRSIKTINSFSIYPEAEYWIRRELKIKFAWDEKSDVVKQFNQLVKRRFSAM